jgi:hypothetical protein
MLPEPAKRRTGPSNAPEHINDDSEDQNDDAGTTWLTRSWSLTGPEFFKALFHE